jgi:hypothetical protein
LWLYKIAIEFFHLIITSYATVLANLGGGYSPEEVRMGKTSLDLEDFVIEPVSGEIPRATAAEALAGGQDPLGPLGKLRGTWKGKGFNQIWRPFDGLQQQPPQDRFLELNETAEILQFVEILGDIPNRGLLQVDINLHGLTYLQRINDVKVLTNGKPTGIHIEPGIWLRIPNTANPQDPETVARLANIPHGTSLVSQGTAKPGPIPLVFPATDIIPFVIGDPNNKITTFPEPDLSKPTQFRTPPADIPNVTQQMVDNPNVVLAAANAGKTIKSVTQLTISTTDLNPPASGGGTSNIAFLTGAGGNPNAQAAQMDATFWISDFVDAQAKPGLQLQYSQRVLLNFNGLSWPHVSVATLLKVP